MLAGRESAAADDIDTDDARSVEVSRVARMEVANITSQYHLFLILE